MNNSWEQRKFEELYEKVSRKNDMTYGTDDIISVANMYYKQDAVVKNEEYLKTYNIFELGDIAFEGNKSKSFAYGRFVENTIGSGIVSHVFDVFKPIMEYDLSFWKHYINCESVMGPIMARVTKASTMMTTLVAKDFLKETISVPTLKEQQKIGIYLDSIDNLITLHHRKYEIIDKSIINVWEQRKLEELIIEYKETVDSDCTLPVLTSSKTEGVLLQEDHFGRKQQHDISGYNVLPRNYCTYRNRSDGTDFTFNINKCCDKGIISKFYPVFCGKDNDTFFISLVLNNSEEVVREIGYTCTGTGQKVLSFLDLQKMNIRVPAYTEQKKISSYFEQLDNLITLHQRKCDETKTIKKYMLQKMFPKKDSKVPEIRFGGFTDDWEQRKVSEITKFHKQGFYTTEDYNESKKYYLLRGTDLTENKLILKDTPKIDATEKDYQAFKTEVGDFLIVRSGTVGTYGIVYEDIPAIFGSYLIDFRFDMEQVTNEFFGYFYQSESFKTQLRQIVQQSANTNINAENIKSTSIMLPSIDEQKRIGEYLGQIDNLITLHQRKLDNLKKFKKGLLQKMFIKEKGTLKET